MLQNLSLSKPEPEIVIVYYAWERGCYQDSLVPVAGYKRKKSAPQSIDITHPVKVLGGKGAVFRSPSRK